MSNFGEGYIPAEYKTGAPIFADGDYGLRIEEVIEGYSQTGGNLMRTIKMAVQGQGTTLDFFLVKNEYFDANATKFFDCFKITHGDFEISHWLKKTGKGHIIQEPYTNKQGKPAVSMKIKFLVVDKPNAVPINQAAMAQRVFQNPAQATYQKADGSRVQAGKFEDDLSNIPF